jgi:hypothetical protein
MLPDQAQAFDAEMTALVSPFAVDGFLSMQLVSTIIWGKPKTK